MIPKMPTFVSFWAGPGYEAEARCLEVTLRRHRVPHYVEALKDAGSWQANCQRKPAFLQRMLDRFGRVVWIDADARLRWPPTWFLSPVAAACDVAYLTFKREVLSGTVLVNDTKKARCFLSHWEEECIACPDKWDQECMKQAAINAAHGLEVAPLPPSYCFIFDTFLRTDLSEMAHYREHPPVIEHFQASRRLKR